MDEWMSVCLEGDERVECRLWVQLHRPKRYCGNTTNYRPAPRVHIPCIHYLEFAENTIPTTAEQRRTCGSVYKNAPSTCGRTSPPTPGCLQITMDCGTTGWRMPSDRATPATRGSKETCKWADWCGRGGERRASPVVDREARYQRWSRRAAECDGAHARRHSRAGKRGTWCASRAQSC